MSVNPRHIRWREVAPAPSAPVQLFNYVRGAVSPGFRQRNTIVSLLRETQVPFVDSADSASEHAIGLLQLAAEVEHALFVQYLYASISVESDEAKRQLLRIAVQEMGHLATVQNLLLLVGGVDALHLQRDVLREHSDKNPLPLVLELVAEASLAKYVSAERPAQIPAALQPEVAALEEIAKQATRTDVHRVGAIYAVLKWMFLPPAAAADWIDLEHIIDLPPNFGHLDDSMLVTSAVMDAHEARGSEWPAADGQFILQAARTCADAVNAIDRIASQGEGVGAADHSHFEAFLDLYRSFKAGQINVSSIARNPTLASITNTYTRLWGEVFALQYELIIFSVLHALYTPRLAGGGGLRPVLSDLAMRGMRGAVLSVASLITTLPESTTTTDLAGPPFDLNPSLLEIHSGDDLVSRHLERLTRLAELYTQIRANPNFTDDHGFTVADLEALDKRRRDAFLLKA